MHPSAYQELEKFSQTLPKAHPLKIGDVGSYDISGCLRPIFAKMPWIYRGIDMTAGPNVDIVVPAEGRWGNIPDGDFDVVVTVSTLEHTKRPWEVMKEIARIMKPGGVGCICAPYSWFYHAHPIDCWRIFPDGMKVIMEDAGLQVEEIHTKEEGVTQGLGDTIGVCRKPK